MAFSLIVSGLTKSTKP